MKCAWRVNAAAKLQMPILLQIAYNGSCAKYAVVQCLLLVETQLCGFASHSLPQLLQPRSWVQNYRVNIKSFPDYKHLLQENFDTSRLCSCNITINIWHKTLETNLMVKKNVCIPRSFLVINVCIQGKTLCSPCIIMHCICLQLYTYLCPVYWGRCFDANYCIICNTVYSSTWLVIYLRVWQWRWSRR